MPHWAGVEVTKLLKGFSFSLVLLLARKKAKASPKESAKLRCSTHWAKTSMVSDSSSDEGRGSSQVSSQSRSKSTPKFQLRAATQVPYSITTSSAMPLDPKKADQRRQKTRWQGDNRRAYSAQGCQWFSRLDREIDTPRSTVKGATATAPKRRMFAFGWGSCPEFCNGNPRAP